MACALPAACCRAQQQLCTCSCPLACSCLQSRSLTCTCARGPLDPPPRPAWHTRASCRVACRLRTVRPSSPSRFLSLSFCARHSMELNLDQHPRRVFDTPLAPAGEAVRAVLLGQHPQRALDHGSAACPAFRARAQQLMGIKHLHTHRRAGTRAAPERIRGRAHRRRSVGHPRQSRDVASQLLAGPGLRADPLR